MINNGKQQDWHIYTYGNEMTFEHAPIYRLRGSCEKLI